MTEARWVPVRDLLPDERQQVMLTGDSGYRAPFDRFLALGYRTSNCVDGTPMWRGVDGDLLAEQGWTPTHWAQLPPFPVRLFHTWQPMSTVPRDRLVDLWARRASDGAPGCRMADMRWSEARVLWFAPDGRAFPDTAFTHWQDIPEEPRG